MAEKRKRRKKPATRKKEPIKTRSHLWESAVTTLGGKRRVTVNMDEKYFQAMKRYAPLLIEMVRQTPEEKQLRDRPNDIAEFCIEQVMKKMVEFENAGSQATHNAG